MRSSTKTWNEEVTYKETDGFEIIQNEVALFLYGEATAEYAVIYEPEVCSTADLSRPAEFDFKRIGEVKFEISAIKDEYGNLVETYISKNNKKLFIEYLEGCLDETAENTLHV